MNRWWWNVVLVALAVVGSWEHCLAEEGFLAGAGTDCLPVVELKPGPNQVVIWVVNNTVRELRSMHLVAEVLGQPDWLRVATASEAIDVSRADRAPHKLTLGADVIYPHEDASARVLLTLEDAEGSRREFEVLVKVKSMTPTSCELFQNRPNPFNPATTISYEITGNANQSVKLFVFGLLGQRVRTLVDGQQASGFYEVFWDGTDDWGQKKMASGVYFFRLEVGSLVKTRKMLLVE